MIPMTTTPIWVWLRGREDFRESVTGAMLHELQQLAGALYVSEIKPDPKDNPLSVTIQLGSMDQLASVQEIAQSWAGEDLTEGERMERTVTVVDPNGEVLGFVWTFDDALAELELDLNVADCEALLWEGRW